MKSLNTPKIKLIQNFKFSDHLPPHIQLLLIFSSHYYITSAQLLHSQRDSFQHLLAQWNITLTKLFGVYQTNRRSTVKTWWYQFNQKDTCKSLPSPISTVTSTKDLVLVRSIQSHPSVNKNPTDIITLWVYGVGKGWIYSMTLRLPCAPWWVPRLSLSTKQPFLVSLLIWAPDLPRTWNQPSLRLLLGKPHTLYPKLITEAVFYCKWTLL